MKFLRLHLIFLFLTVLVFSGCLKSPSGEHSQKNKFIFLTEEYSPLNYTEKGKPEGMAIEVVEAICKELNIKPEFQFMLWKDAYRKALKEPNVVIFSMTKTKLRKNNFYWLEPSIIKFKEYFYRKEHADIKIKTLGDAKKYKIGTTADFYSEEVLKSMGFNLESYFTQEDTIRALMEDKVDLIIMAGFRKEFLVMEMGYSGNDILPAYEIDTGHMYIALSKGTSEKVVEEWQKAFDYIREKKIYFKIYKKWFFGNKLFNK